jgi:sugar phosphate isomerase/epimerase
MHEALISRRDALRKAALGGLLVPLAALPRLTGADAPPAKAAGGRLVLGLAGYSMRKLSTDQAIAALHELGIRSAALYKIHLPILISTPDVCRDMAARFRGAGITIASTGVVSLTNSESVMRRAFECARAAGLSTMTASYPAPPDRDTLLLTERFVREYDIRLAFHNHGPEDATFPSPYDVWRTVQPYDARLGLCIDVGHAARAGADPVAAIRDCRTRLYDVHIKDSVAPVGAKKDLPVGLGFGRIDIRGILAALLDIGYPYQVGLEDEVESPDPIPGMAQSFGYLRGTADALYAGRSA